MDSSCPICLEKAVSPYPGPDWQFAGQNYRLSRCHACGSVFTAPLPSDAALENLYRTSFDYRWYQDHYSAKLRDCRMRIKEYRAHLGKRVLDFGGGVGYFSEAASEAGMESVTYDPYVSTRIADNRPWDSIVALHMLEHSNNLDRTILQIKELLAHEGKVILAVPNFEGLGYQTLGMHWVWAQPPLLHVFHFTTSGMKALLARHGFSDIVVSYHERWDANLISDLKHHNRQKYLDSLWGLRPFNRFLPYRKLVAGIVSWLRFADLELSMQEYSRDCSKYSELQVIARKTSA